MASREGHFTLLTCHQLSRISFAAAQTIHFSSTALTRFIFHVTPSLMPSYISRKIKMFSFFLQANDPFLVLGSAVANDLLDRMNWPDTLGHTREKKILYALSVIRGL